MRLGHDRRRGHRPRQHRAGACGLRRRGGDVGPHHLQHVLQQLLHQGPCGRRHRRRADGQPRQPHRLGPHLRQGSGWHHAAVRSGAHHQAAQAHQPQEGLRRGSGLGGDQLGRGLRHHRAEVRRGRGEGPQAEHGRLHGGRPHRQRLALAYPGLRLRRVRGHVLGHLRAPASTSASFCSLATGNAMPDYDNVDDLIQFAPRRARPRATAST